VYTAHGIETRYVAKEAQGLLASTDSPCVSTESRKASHAATGDVTAEDRTPEANQSLNKT
jgi:hypothetical protein